LRTTGEAHQPPAKARPSAVETLDDAVWSGLFAEARRLLWLRGLEETLADLGYRHIAGVDEAGRGCLAGPVVAGAVLVERGVLVPGVDDSKELTAEHRERLATAIRKAHPVHATVAVSAADIDRINILQATRRAMTQAVQRLSGLGPRPDMVLVDAVKLDLDMPHLPVIRGDQISYAVACASILAKTARDRLMVDLGRRFPAYSFAANKGYGSQVHRDALVEYGPCPEHRLTFRSVLPAAGGATWH
jgi:ribonuclease HII